MVVFRIRPDTLKVASPTGGAGGSPRPWRMKKALATWQNLPCARCDLWESENGVARTSTMTHDVIVALKAFKSRKALAPRDLGVIAYHCYLLAVAKYRKVG